jgi:integrase/recombinase XerD
MVTIEHLKTRVSVYCPSCGVMIRKTARFCADCGQKIERSVIREASRRRVRRLPVDSDTLKRIKVYVDAGGPVSRNGRQLLFGIGRTHAWKIVSECARKAGLSELVFSESGIKHGVSPHRLRDAFAVYAVKKDDSADALRVLQEHLGHQSIATTMRYRKLSGEEHREWFDRLWNEGE